MEADFFLLNIPLSNHFLPKTSQNTIKPFINLSVTLKNQKSLEITKLTRKNMNPIFFSMDV
jgi:hypothetical protein